MKSRFYFENISIDRAHAQRADNDYLSLHLNTGSCRILPVWRNYNLFLINNKSPKTAQAIILGGKQATKIINNTMVTVFLGIEKDEPYFAADLSHLEDPYIVDLPDGAIFQDLRQFSSDLNNIDAGYLAYARALTYWHRTNQFCGSCGSKTIINRGGHERKCSNIDCNKNSFPRTDPAVIMLVTHPTEEKCLLGHNKKFQGLRFSTIAGFVEPGEMLEQAVIREVFEETNINVSDVKYKASQPWPFPASIMLGFTARAINSKIICHDGELVEAKWFSRNEVLDMARTSDTLPPKNLSISRWLIDTWLDKRQ